MFQRHRAGAKAMADVRCRDMGRSMPSASRATPATPPTVVWFENLGGSDVPLVGGKNSRLGEIAPNLGAAALHGVLAETVPPSIQLLTTKRLY